MSREIYQKLREFSLSMARSLPSPLFYEEHAALIGRVNETLGSDEFILQCRDYLDESQLECAHGLCHCEAVARDAGVIVLIEADKAGMPAPERERLYRASIIAGLLHDIKRREQDHALRGGLEAEKILSHLGMDLQERQYIADAIRNHEAFQETIDRDDTAGRLISDALYDADKFRWGPENFSTTLWLMVTTHQTPVERLHAVFLEKMKGIEKIKETFRTKTGQQYGPEFIDQGIMIGKAIYEEMTALLHAKEV